MKYDTYTEKELAREPLGVAVIKIMHGSCPACTAKIQCQIGRAKHKITYCESCGQKILWECEKWEEKEKAEVKELPKLSESLRRRGYPTGNMSPESGKGN